MRTRLLAGLALSALLPLLAATQANAAIFRAYLSSSGNDANPCTLPEPCRLLPAAMATVNPGGEVWILDSANFNTGAVAINKSVTILALPGVVGSFVANNAHALTIAGAGIRVTLRNLVFVNLAGAGNYGVHMTQGTSLTVIDSSFTGLTGAGVNVASNGTKAQIITSTFNANAVGVRTIGGVLHLDKNIVVNNAIGLQAGGSGGANANLPNGPVQIRVSGGSVLDNTIAYHMESPGLRSSGQCNGWNIFLRNDIMDAGNATRIHITGAYDGNPGCTLPDQASIGSLQFPIP